VQDQLAPRVQPDPAAPALPVLLVPGCSRAVQVSRARTAGRPHRPAFRAAGVRLAAALVTGCVTAWWRLRRIELRR
jgi:hypothetical protein